MKSGPITDHSNASLTRRKIFISKFLVARYDDIFFIIKIFLICNSSRGLVLLEKCSVYQILCLKPIYFTNRESEIKSFSFNLVWLDGTQYFFSMNYNMKVSAAILPCFNRCCSNESL